MVVQVVRDACMKQWVFPEKCDSGQPLGSGYPSGKHAQQNNNKNCIHACIYKSELFL